MGTFSKKVRNINGIFYTSLVALVLHSATNLDNYSLVVDKVVSAQDLRTITGGKCTK